MFPVQRVFRIFVVIESNEFPTLLSMAGLASVAKRALVFVLFAVACLTGRRRFLFGHGNPVAFLAGDEFVRAERPDVVLVSPLVHFGSAQADVVASARALGIPVGMLLFSWDNLSTKGRLHRRPDWMFVWNDRQRAEARALHGFPEDRVVVVGAPRFDSFFTLRQQMTRDAFFVPLGLDPERPALLYVCSSPFVSAGELAFIRRWLTALRASDSEALRTCTVIVRPHPDVALVGPETAIEELRWDALRGVKALVARPFDDDQALIVRTSDRALQGFYECLAHSAAVVGLNTSAELEAAIVGRPVYTVLADAADADGQQGTLHFHYLLESGGGFVRVARTLDDHVAQLAAELASPSDPERLQRFVEAFLRPLGARDAVSPRLADAIERTFAAGVPADERPGDTTLRPDLSKTPPAPILPEAMPIQPEPFSSPRADIGRAAHAVDAPAAGVTTLPIGRDLAAIQVWLPSTPGADPPRVDKTIVQWLMEHVRVGEIVCDVNAGVGVYSVIAAKYRGAEVIAFEPGYAAFDQLCDNLLLNGCDGSVMPIPLTLADFEGLGELKFPSDRPGLWQHTVRRAAWRNKRSARTGRTLAQTVCVTSLDQALRRHELPMPNHVRLGEPTSALAVLAGAAALLASGALATVFLTVPTEGCNALASTLPAPWRIATHLPISRGRSHVLLTKATPTARV